MIKINKVNICLFAAHLCFMEAKNAVTRIISVLPFLSKNQSSEKQSTKPKNHKEMFLDIIKLNDTHAIQAFIKHTGANIHQFGPQDETTPLIEASAQGYINSVYALIKAGADVTATDKLHGRTPLQWAFVNKHFDVCKGLLDAMTPEQIDFQMKYEPTRFPTLNTLIQTHQIKKLILELSTIYTKNLAFSPFTTLPFEILTPIISQNYPTLTSEQISQNMALVFKRVYGSEETTKLEATPKPVIFSTAPSATIPIENKNLVKTNEGYGIEKKSTLRI